MFCLAGSEKQSAVSTGWLPVSAMIGSGDNDTPVHRAYCHAIQKDVKKAIPDLRRVYAAITLDEAKK